ncbi:phage holin family protein [Streptomyces sp. NPDC050504]|uniref:phage holin family protein n=1 Tax=Streptomyces sp. NPDC050504 TaxID=3365618 RepID=UPI003793EB22
MTTTDPHSHREEAEAPTSELVQRATRQLSDLVRQEMRLAQAEMAQKGKRFGRGSGLFGGAALLGALTSQALVATAIAAIAEGLPVWMSALIVAGALAVAAGVLAAAGRSHIRRAGPSVTQQTVDNVKADIAEIKKKANP